MDLRQPKSGLLLLQKLCLKCHLLSVKSKKGREARNFVQIYKGDPFRSQQDLRDTIGRLGVPWQRKLGKKGLALASALQRDAVINLTYSEGGNVLIGQRTNGTQFIIVGMDSFAVSKALMERDLGHKINEKKVKRAFAIDYGVREDDIFLVEQPGDFHLDMKMAIIGSNTIAVNDSMAAAKAFETDFSKYLRGKSKGPDYVESMQIYNLAKAEQEKKLEDETARQLKQMGFNVVRVAGCFDCREEGELPKTIMNFFNMVTATTPQGNKVVIATGMISKKYREAFQSFLQLAEDKTFPLYIYYLDLTDSINSLRARGGISCRTKTIPMVE